MVIIIALAAAFLLLSTGAAFAQGPQPPSSSETTQVPVGGQEQPAIEGNVQSPTAGQKEISPQDRTFVTKATIGNLAERQSSERAISQGDARAVEEFAQRMVVDHRNAQEQLGQLASALDIGLPLELDQEHEQMLRKLRDERGQSFDRLYAGLQVQMHEEAVELYRAQATQGQNAELKQFAEGLLPALQGHLEMARAMADEVAR